MTHTTHGRNHQRYRAAAMSEIPRRPFGATGLEVTTLGFGAMELRGPPDGPALSDEDAGRLLNAVLDEGKVRFVGVSGFLPNLDAQIGMGVFEAYQIPYSALQREHEQAIERASAAGAGIVIRGGVARGTPDDWESRRYYMVDNETLRNRWEAARLDDLLDGSSRTSFLLRFTLSHPGLDTTIVGTSSLAHLRDNIASAALGPLPDDVLAEARRRLDAAGSRSAG